MIFTEDNKMENNIINNAPATVESRSKKPAVLMAASIAVSALINAVLNMFVYFFITEPSGNMSYGGEIALFTDINALIQNIAAFAIPVIFACMAYKCVGGRVKFIASALVASKAAAIARCVLQMIIGTIFTLIHGIDDYGFAHTEYYSMALAVFGFVVQIPFAIIIMNAIDKFRNKQK